MNTPNKNISNYRPSSRGQTQGGRGGFKGNYHQTDQRTELNNKYNESDYNNSKYNNDKYNNNHYDDNYNKNYDNDYDYNNNYNKNYMNSYNYSSNNNYKNNNENYNYNSSSNKKNIYNGNNYDYSYNNNSNSNKKTNYNDHYSSKKNNYNKHNKRNTIQNHTELKEVESPPKSLGDLIHSRNTVSYMSNNNTNLTNNNHINNNNNIIINNSSKVIDSTPQVKKNSKSKKTIINYDNLPDLNSSNLSKNVNESKDVLEDTSMVSEDNRTFNNENDRSILSVENFEINKTLELDNSNFYYGKINGKYCEDRKNFIDDSKNNTRKISVNFENEKIIDISMNDTQDEFNLNLNNMENEREKQAADLKAASTKTENKALFYNNNDLEDHIVSAGGNENFNVKQSIHKFIIK